MKFAILFPDGKVVNQDTIIRRKGERVRITTRKEVLKLIKNAWCQWCNVKSFKQWADDCSEELGGGFVSDDAVSHMSSNYTLNIDGKHVSIYDAWHEEFGIPKN